MNEAFSHSFGQGISRRRALTLVSILGLAGCSGWEADQDTYIQKMKQDPLFPWVPPGKAKRDVSYVTIGSGLEPRGTSEIDISLTPSQGEDPAMLLASAQKGYA